MFQSPIFDIVIALPFLYAILSLACTAIHEWIASALQLRARSLQRTLLKLLNQGVNLSPPFYAHTLIRELYSVSGHPSYLSAATFSRVMVDVITHTQTAAVAAQEVLNSVNLLPSCGLKVSLLNFLRHVNLQEPDAIVNIHQRLESWFDAAMQRTTALYQRRAQFITCGIAFFVCVAVNADSLKVVRVLWSSPSVRAQVAAEAVANGGHNLQTVPSRIQIEEQLGSLLSWADDVRESGCALGSASGWFSFLLWCIPRRLAGWLLTTVAISLGAPFWFDILNRFVRLRLAEPRPVAPAVR